MKQSSKTKAELPAEKSPQKKKIQKLKRPKAGLKSADKDLHESESPYKTLFNRAAEGILVAELKTKRFKYANAAICRMFGYMEEEMLKLGVHDIHPEESLKEVLADFDALKRDKQTWALNIPCRRKDGSIFYANISMTSVFLEGVQCNAGFFTDITDLKKAQDNLSKSERKFSSIFHMNLDPIAITYTATGKMVDVNEAFVCWTGYSREEIIGFSSKDLHLWVNPEDREKMINALTESVAIHGEEILMRRKNGDVRNMLFSARYIDIDQERYLLTLAHDITDRKQAEESLRESEDKFRHLFESAGDSIFLLDNDVFIDCNPRALEMFGCTREQIIGQPPSRFSPEIQPDGTFSKEQAIANNQAVLKGQPRYFEWKHCRHDGTFFYAAISLTAFLDRGKPYILAICRDITENKRVLEALHESEEKYRTLFENAGEAIVVVQDDKAVFLNPMMATLTGCSNTELSSRPFVNFIHADDREIVMDNRIRRLNGENVPSRYSFRLLHKNDGFRWVDLNVVKINWKGKPATLNFMIDITERKLSEEKAKESHALLRIAGEKAKLGGWSVNLEENHVIWSDEVAVIHEMPVGYSPLVEQGISFYAPQWQARMKKVFADCTQKGIPYDEEMEIITAGGRSVWVRTIGESVKDDTGKIIKVHGAFQDITDRKQIELELRASESNYRNSFNDSPLGVRISTIEGETIYANKAILDIYGYNSVEELKKKSIKERYTPESYAEWLMRKEKRLQGAFGPSEYEISIVRKNGEIRHLQAFRNEIFWDGAVRFQIYYNDITERKRAEEEKRKLEERLNRVEKMEALGQLAGGVAHDLNNVLGVLSGYAELLLMEIPEGQRARNHAEKIMQSTEKGAAIVQDLLTLARRGVTTSEVVDLNDVVSDFFKTPVFENIQGYHPHVNFKIGRQEALLKIKGSPIHLEKTLMNLVLNAAEAIPGKGEVTIRTENRYLEKAIMGYDEVKEGDYVVLTVSDTGTGILAENREKIFEPFYTKKTMGRSGTGLGLAIVWGTVKDHKGYIDVQTEDGQGTTFTLYFPVTREEMTSAQQKKCMEEYMGHGETVLVVDDIPDQREVASALLQKLGYKVRAVSSGEEAVEYLRQNKTDLLILDMIMVPGFDGLETYQRILEISPKQKAVIVSGFSETDRVKEAQKLGAGTYIKKPYVMETLGMAIRNELQR
jgi:PAS domain S-box-containing protein